MIETRNWWALDRQNFDLYTSQAVLFEASRGDPQAAEDRLQVLAGLPILRPTAASDALAKLLITRAALPLKAQMDAVHLAIAAVSGMSYLLTWNCRHLANATMRAKIEETCRDSGCKSPII